MGGAMNLEPDDGQELVLERIAAGESLLIEGGPGTGKSTVLRRVFESLVVDSASSAAWSPVLVLTPDRRRAVEMEERIGPQLLGAVQTPGGHRVVRAVNSYAYLVISQWLVERESPLPRPVLTAGPDEDIWFGAWLEENADEWGHVFPKEAALGDALRMELRNAIARAGERGISPEDVGHIAGASGVPAWELLASAYLDYAGGADRVFTTETPHIDSARIQLIAAQTLDRWGALAAEQGLLTGAPVPECVLVDDLQDYTPATVQLLAALRRAGAQVVATSSSVTGTAAFRGAGADTGELVQEALGLPAFHLETNHRNSPPIATVVQASAGWVDPTIAKPAAPGHPLAPVIVPGEGRRGAWIAGSARRYHYLQDVPWERQVVIVRSADDIDPMRRQLLRAGVPLAPGDRPLQFSKEPVTRAMLDLLADQSGRDVGEAAMRFLSSPLVNADRLSLYRFLRSHQEGDLSFQDQLVNWLDEPSLLGDTRIPAAQRHTLELLRSASRVWRTKEAAAQMSPQLGLWALWEAADLASAWQQQALGSGPEAVRADDRLDAVISLFRRADLWEQQEASRAEDHGPAISARAFAEEMLEQKVASDSIAQVGTRPSGLSVLTVSQAAGKEWDVVYVSGLQDGRWPTRTRPGGMLHLERFEQLLSALPLHDIYPLQPNWLARVDPELFSVQLDQRQYRRRRRFEEAKLFIAAASRARNNLHLVAVENEAESASVFLTYLAAQGALAAFREEDGSARLTDVPAAFDIPTAIGLLRRGTVDPDLSEDEQRQAAALLAIMAANGVNAADPTGWIGGGPITSDSPLLNPEEPMRLNPSQIQGATDCTLQWFFRAVQGEDRPGILLPKAVDAADIGSLVHAVAEEVPGGQLELMLQSFQEKWDALHLDEEKWWVRRQKERLLEMIQVMSAQFRKVSGQVLVEQPIRAEFGSVSIFARADRLEWREDGTVCIVDIKTGSTSQSATDTENNLQLATYQLGLRDQYQVGGAALLQVGAGKREPVTRQSALEDQRAEDLRAQLTDLGQAMRGPIYQAKPVAICRQCRFRAVCPVQSEGARSVP